MVPFVVKINTSIAFFISIIDGFDYTMDYMENIARSFRPKYPRVPMHQKQSKIKAFLTDRVKAKVEAFVNAEAKNVTVRGMARPDSRIQRLGKFASYESSVRCPFVVEVPEWSLP